MQQKMFDGWDPLSTLPDTAAAGKGGKGQKKRRGAGTARPSATILPIKSSGQVDQHKHQD